MPISANWSVLVYLGASAPQIAIFPCNHVGGLALPYTPPGVAFSSALGKSDPLLLVKLTHTKNTI